MIYILFSIILFSINNVLWKKNLQNLSVPFLIAYRAFFTSVVSVIVLLFIYDFSGFKFNELYKITLGSLFGVIGLFCMLIVVKKASLQWIGIYNLVGIFISSIYLWVFETIDFTKSIVGMVLIVSGFLFFIFSTKMNHKINVQQHLLLLVMILSFNLSSIIHWKNLTKNIHPLLIISNQEIVVFISALCVLLLSKKKIKIIATSKPYFLKVFLMSTIILLALFFSFIGLKVTNPIISGILFLASPLTTIFFSTFYFKEEVTLKNSIAISIVAFGAFILHYTSI
jgi:hypothetical protein